MLLTIVGILEERPIKWERTQKSSKTSNICPLKNKISNSTVLMKTNAVMVMELMSLP